MFRVVFCVVFASMFVPNLCFGINFMEHNPSTKLFQPVCDTLCYPKNRNFFLLPLHDNFSKYLFFCGLCERPDVKPTTPSTVGTRPTAPAISTGTKKPTAATPSPEVPKPPAPAPSEEPPAPPAPSEEPPAPPAAEEEAT